MKRNKKNRLVRPPAASAVVATNTAALVPVEAKVVNAGAPVKNNQGMLAAFGPPGIPQQGRQISQDTTLWSNLRWYLVSNERQLLSQCYVEIGLIQTVIDIPVDDGLRGGVEIKSSELDEDEIAELVQHIEIEDDIGIAGQALKWNRLYGGAGVLILTNQDPATPLDMSLVSADDNLKFKAVDMWELFWDMQNIEGFNPAIQDESFEFYSYYGHKVHKSRVLRLKGLEAPSLIRPRLRGWGYSVVEILIRSINQFLKGSDLTFEVLDEFKIDVYRLKDLAATLMSEHGQNVVHDRVETMNMIKNYLNAIVLDKEDEYEQKQLTFAGLAEAAAGIRLQVASDLRMPLTKIFGISAAGFNSGEDDIEVYNSMVEGQVRAKIKFHILKMVQLKCQVLFGFVPNDLAVAFKPLRVLGAEQEENVKTQKFSRALQALQAAAISIFEFRDMCNKGNLFDIKLDTKGRLPALGTPAALAAAAGDDPGADKPPTEESKTGKAAPGTRGGKVTKEGKQLAKDPPKAKEAPDQGPKRYTYNSLGRYSRRQLIGRVLKNSAEFDRASYEADGGDGWVDPRRREFFTNPVGVDTGLWSKAKQMSQSAFGEERWQFVLWAYRKLGGTHA